MSRQKPLFAQLLVKPLTRKEFLLHLGLVLLALSGIPALLKTLSSPDPVQPKTRRTSSRSEESFGGGAYGA
ncbi:MAG: hypothetical protein WDN67_03055 [Candidatus Moraniibacteriota bacterium]